VKALLRGWLYVPNQAVTNRQALKTALTHIPFVVDNGSGEQSPVPICMYDESLAGYIGVPREWGLHNFPRLEIKDETTLGLSIPGPNKLPDPNHPSVLDPAAQARFMDGLLAGTYKHGNFLACAATGSGKTVVALRTAAKLGRKTLILVHLVRLMQQWKKQITAQLGVHPSKIGLIQQNVCDYEGKDYCIALMPSLSRRQYPAEFYQQFGTVIVDEVHKMGTGYFAPVAPQFPAKFRIGLTATPKRKDGGDKVFFYHLGPIRLTSEAEALPLRVRVINRRAFRKYWPKTPGGVDKVLVNIPERNQSIATFVKRFYTENRQAIIVSSSIDHLETLMRLSSIQGVPREKMGLFTAQKTDPNTGRRIKTTQAELDAVQSKAQIIFATYGMITEGIDIPRLDAGIDATPRGSATQLVGRIRRPLPGKPVPVWITIRDVGCDYAERCFRGRMKDYSKPSIEVTHHG
jgi:superfamily II DNA or RNA helicase